MKLRTIAWLSGLFLFAASAGTQAAEPSELDKIMAAKVVRVGAVEAPPWYDKDLASGEWQGLVPDVMNAVFAKAGIKVEYVDTQWGTAIAGLQSDRFDLVGAYNSTPERALAVDFTRPMGALKLSVLSLDANKDYSSWDKLDSPSVRIAAIDGAGATRALQPVMPKADWVLGQSSDDMFLQLQSGRADVLVTSDIQIAKYLRAGNKGKMTIPTPVMSQPTNIALRKSTDPKLREWLDGALTKLEADGTLNTLWQKYTEAAK